MALQKPDAPPPGWTFEHRVAEWLVNMVKAVGDDRANIELEIRLGTIRAGQTDVLRDDPEHRWSSETVVVRRQASVPTRFDAGVTDEGYAACTKLISEAVARNPAAAATLSRQTSRQDIHQSLAGQTQPGWEFTKIRTSQAAGSTTRHSTAKRSYGTLDVMCPRRGYDFRIAVATEREYPVETADRLPVSLTRRIDRVSVRMGDWRFDMSSVVHPTGTLYEIEVELLEVPRLLAVVAMWEGGVPGPLLDLVNEMLDNARELTGPGPVVAKHPRTEETSPATAGPAASSTEPTSTDGPPPAKIPKFE